MILDFEGVSLATQSFVHALIAEAVRSETPAGLDHLVFKNCSSAVRSIIEVVISYAQDDWSDVGREPEQTNGEDARLA
ncbi:STAS-like domain-containing protein [Microbacterium kribbense]|uniref:STAS-like domain-containing protein n=1 Tax=Microbacterium kribbense TaxID=433645 RepID=UPI003CD06B92